MVENATYFLNIPIGIPIKANPVNAYVPKQQFVFIKTRIVIRDSVLLRGNAYVFVNYARSVHWDPATATVGLLRALAVQIQPQ